MRLMISTLLKPLSLFSLPTIHRLGAALGCILYYCLPQIRSRTRENMLQSKLFPELAQSNQALKLTFTELGKAMLETPAIWQTAHHKIGEMVKEVHNWQAVEQALAKGKGIIFLTPHLGCFEITSLYYGLHHPITVLYRPPKKDWLMPLIMAGRTRNNVSLAPANTSGVRMLMQALKNNEAIGILPDQIPAAGEGEWADFFGKQAYTMLLASKLAEKTGATVIMGFGERLADGKGYAIHLTTLDDHAIATPALLNAALETQIKQCPTQYYWNYHRYKVSRKSKPLPAN